jgi:hypothetical protein
LAASGYLGGGSVWVWNQSRMRRSNSAWAMVEAPRMCPKASSGIGAVSFFGVLRLRSSQVRDELRSE